MIETAKKAAKLGGKILLEGFGNLSKGQISLKGMGDYVTEIDHESERAIIDTIRRKYPNHIIQAEESGLDCRDSSYRWIIDPLDGTANYIQKIPMFAISIAVMRDTELLSGVILDPVRGELFWAERGKGAFLNNDPVRVSEKKDMAYSMLASGFPWRSKEHLDAYLRSFKEVFIQSSGIRRMGAAALDLAYTACGRFDGFWEMKLKPWDIAAGILLVEEAGGIVTDFLGSKEYMRSGNVVAGNKKTHAVLLNATKKHLSHV